MLKNVKKNIWLFLFFYLIYITRIIDISLLSASDLSSKDKQDIPIEIMALSEAFANVAEKVKPAVVNVYVESVYEQRIPDYEFFFGDPFEQFFGDNSRDRINKNRVFKRKVEGSASGVIINEEGYVLTNYHVVSDADEIKIALPGDQEHKFAGKIIGVDDRLDLAIVKINAPGHKFNYARLGDSDKVKVGNWVIAIGSPFGLEQTVTSGIISAKRQSIDIGGRRYKYMLQTDAAINMGNSGGPLVNLKGEVIGINSAIWAPTGVFAGIGFAIPINMAKEILNDLVKKGKVVRGWLGIEIRKLDPGISKIFGLKKNLGALVNAVLVNSPAEKAGIKRGDIIIGIDDEDITDDFELQTKIGSNAPGTEIKVKIIRQGKEIILKTRLEEAPARLTELRKKEQKIANEKQYKKIDEYKWHGITVIDLSKSIRERLQIDEKTAGVVIKDVEPDSRFSDTLFEGDCIANINNNPISSVSDFEKILNKINLKEGLLIDLIRGGKAIYVSISGAE